MGEATVTCFLAVSHPNPCYIPRQSGDAFSICLLYTAAHKCSAGLLRVSFYGKLPREQVKVAIKWLWLVVESSMLIILVS